MKRIESFYELEDVFIEEHSRGPAIRLLLAELVVWGARVVLNGDLRPILADIIVDETLGPIGMRLVAAIQEAEGISVSGGVGPEMQKAHDERFNYSLEELMEDAGGENFLVQLDGTEIAWYPDGVPAEEVAVAHEAANEPQSS